MIAAVVRTWRAGFGSLLCCAALSAAAALQADPAAAAAPTAPAFPVKPVRLVVGFSPGGGSDTVGRIVGTRMGELWSQSVLVDNRPGAGGNLANELVARAVPDGYVLGCISSSFAIGPSLTPDLKYSTTRDFTAVSQLASAPYLLVVHPSVQAISVKELVALAKAQPGKLNYASAGSGSALHLAAELFKSMAGVDIVHVPYKGAAGITDLLAGTVQMSIAGLPQTMPHVRAGRLRALGVTTRQRAAVAADVPAISEAGVPGYDVDAWYGLVAPAGVAADVVDTVAGAVLQALRTPDVVDRLVQQGLVPRASRPAEFEALIRSDTIKWGRVVSAAKIKAD